MVIPCAKFAKAVILLNIYKAIAIKHYLPRLHIALVSWCHTDSFSLYWRHLTSFRDKQAGIPRIIVRQFRRRTPLYERHHFTRRAFAFILFADEREYWWRHILSIYGFWYWLPRYVPVSFLFRLHIYKVIFSLRWRAHCRHVFPPPVNFIFSALPGSLSFHTRKKRQSHQRQCRIANWYFRFAFPLPHADDEVKELVNGCRAGRLLVTFRLMLNIEFEARRHEISRRLTAARRRHVTTISGWCGDAFRWYYDWFIEDIEVAADALVESHDTSA